MPWLDRLERRFGRYAIPNLMTVIIGGQAVAWLVILLLYRGLYALLPLTRWQLLHGQVWRLVTFLFTPAYTTSPLYLIELFFYWWVGTSLARAWGDFRFDVYFLLGAVGAVLGCLVTGYAGTDGLFLSLFFAYAWMWPEQQVLFMMFIPLKVKWLGWAAAAWWGLQFLFGDLATKAALVFGLLGFLVFFGPSLWRWARDGAYYRKRRQDWRDQWR